MGGRAIPHLNNCGLLLGGLAALGTLLVACFQVGHVDNHSNGKLMKRGEDSREEKCAMSTGSKHCENNKREASSDLIRRRCR